MKKIANVNTSELNKIIMVLKSYKNLIWLRETNIAKVAHRADGTIAFRADNTYNGWDIRVIAD